MKQILESIQAGFLGIKTRMTNLSKDEIFCICLGALFIACVGRWCFLSSIAIVIFLFLLLNGTEE